MDQVLNFKYRDIDANGNTTSIGPRRGAIEEDGIHFKNESVPCDRFVRAEARSNRVVLLFKREDGSMVARVIEVYRVGIDEFTRVFNRIASHAQILGRKAELEAAGRGERMRIRTCGACEGMIDLTDFAESHEVSCPFCDTISNDAVPGKEQEVVRVCDGCRFYAIPKRITCTYIILNYYRWHRKHLCRTCMRREAWKMMGGNAIFILGIPVAVTQLCRVYFGGTTRAGAYRGLDAANRLARKKRLEEARARYKEISDRLGGSCVAHYNSGLACIIADNLPDAHSSFEAALRSCSNSDRAAQALAGAMSARKMDLKTSALLRPFLAEEARG